jgi:alpha-L-arabinofuranosidase
MLRTTRTLLIGCLTALVVITTLTPLTARTSPSSQAPAAQPAQAPQARIKIDIDRTIGEVDPLLFGNFAEHLGRMIYGGIYEEGSPLSDEHGYRKDVLEAVRQLKVSILRWPGGNFCSGYNWYDGIGPKDQRPTRLELAWNDLETNRFGTDEFLRYAEMIGAAPYICVNLGLGTIDDARHWVEYTNAKQKTYWADQRRKNGREEPWNVKYWGLGNEIDGPWQLGHKNAEEYSKFALEAAKAMRAVDPSIKLIASGSSNYGPRADWINWNRTVLQMLRSEIDYIAIHTYIGNRENDLERYLGASSETVERYITTTAALIKEVQAARIGQPTPPGPPGAAPRPIYIAYDEWNVWYRAYNEEKLEEVYNFEDALAMGVFFNSFFRHADMVKMANMAQLVNVIAPITTNKQGLFLQPIYFPLVEFARQQKNTSIDVFVESPTYKVQDRPEPVKYLDVSATFNLSTRELFVNVLNRSKDQNIVSRVQSGEGTADGQLAVWEMNHPDLKATHTFGNDKKVRPVTRTTTVPVQNGSFSYTFPAHSLTILKTKLSR